jgi:hypothetical protein
MRHPLSTPGRSGGVWEWLQGAVAVGGVDGFVVEGAVAQAVPETLEPAVAECAQGGVVGLAGGAFLVTSVLAGQAPVALRGGKLHGRGG